MHFIEPINRAQVTFWSLEDLMTPDNPVRLIDAFADRLDLKRLGFGVMVKAFPKAEVFDELLAKLKKWNPESGRIVWAFFQIDGISFKMTCSFFFSQILIRKFRVEGWGYHRAFRNVIIHKKANLLKNEVFS
jgi:hypothetical protein